MARLMDGTCSPPPPGPQLCFMFPRRGEVKLRSIPPIPPTPPTPHYIRFSVNHFVFPSQPRRFRTPDTRSSRTRGAEEQQATAKEMREVGGRARRTRDGRGEIGQGPSGALGLETDTKPTKYALRRAARNPGRGARETPTVPTWT